MFETGRSVDALGIYGNTRIVLLYLRQELRLKKYLRRT